MLTLLWSRLPTPVQGVVRIALATLLWLAVNFVALWGLQRVDHSPSHETHLVLHLAFLGVMVWIEMQIGDRVAKWSGAELLSKIKRNPIFVAGVLMLLFMTATSAVCFGMCKGSACREGLTQAVLNPPFQPAEGYVVVVIVVCTFLLRGYAWALHHAEVQEALKSAKRAVPPR